MISIKSKNFQFKLTRFIRFVFEYKCPKIVRKWTDEQCLEVYNIYSPWYWKDSCIQHKIIGALTVLVVGNELKKRHPDCEVLQEWDYSKELNLNRLIGGLNNGK